MNGYVGSIDTDAGIGTILSNFSTEFINDLVSDSLNMKFRPFNGPMPNMVDVLDRQLLSVYNNAPDYKDKVSEVRFETYMEIINKICRFYNLTFSVEDINGITSEEVYGIAHTMYDIFVSRFTDYLTNFFADYIYNNAHAIAVYLNADPDSVKPKESGLYNNKNFINEDFIIIHANINTVIYNMIAYDIPLSSLLHYFLDNNAADRLSTFLQDNGDIFKDHYAYYIKDSRYSAATITNIKLTLQSRIQSINILPI